MAHRFDKIEDVDGTLGSSSELPKPESQEFATARYLIDRGFYPTETVCMVRHIHTGHKLGRTLGSVRRAMHLLLELRRA